MKINKIVAITLVVSSMNVMASDMANSLFGGSSSSNSEPKKAVQSPQVTDLTTEVEHKTTKNQRVKDSSFSNISLTNFATGEREVFEPTSLTYEKALEFVPPLSKSEMIFEDLIEKGKEPYIALMMMYMFLESELEDKGTIE